MNIQQLHYILAVAELRHFGLAADKCFVTQSTLSAMIKKFEDKAGVEIFNRRTKPVSITLEGEELIKSIRLIVKRIDDFEEKVKELKGELSGTLRIAIIPTVAPYLLPLFLSAFIEKHKNFHFVIQEANTAQIIELLKKRELDIGITALPLNEELLTEIPLFREPFLWYHADGDLNEVGELNDLESKNFWLLEEGHCMSAQMSRVCGFKTNNGRDSNLSFKAGSIESLISMTESGRGKTILPYLSTLKMNEMQQQKLSHFQPPVPVRQVGLVVHLHFAKRRILQLLKAEILNKVKDVLPVFEKGEVVSPVAL